MHQALHGQVEAALCTLRNCVAKCPDELWHAHVAKLEFNQAAFHALFFADLYLGESVEALRSQDFHRQHAADFADYEELEDRVQQNTYSRGFLNAYIEHCRTKTAQVAHAETEASLAAHCNFPWLKITRLELYPYMARHLQHHAAQLSLRLRLDADQLIGWVRTGWQD